MDRCYKYLGKVFFTCTFCLEDWNFNPFVPNAPFLYRLKTSENLRVFWYFQGVEKGYTHSGFSPFFCEGGRNWIFELNEIRGGRDWNFSKSRGGEKEGGQGNFWNFHWGGNCWRWNFKQETKFRLEFKNVFMSYVINYLSNSSFL